jgi:alpha-ketoglutarate-dependent taurine dioxygenase
MSTQTATDPRAWTRETLPDRSWYFRLPERCWDALGEEARAVALGTPLTEVRPVAAAGRADEFADVRRSLEEGCGVAVIEGTPLERFSAEQIRVVYWLVGQNLGCPVAQNVQGTLLYDVKDTGQDVRSGARFSVTKAESSFHTDSSFEEEITDYVGLLCLQPSRSGGLSQVVSGYSAHQELQRRHPRALEVLSQPFHVDRRGGVRPGEEPTARFPIVALTDRGLVCRYLRYWIEVGHDKAGRPLTADQVEALDTLDRVLNEPGLRAEFSLKPGDMFFVNNRWIFHNRTAFEDFAEPERRRHLVRLWLRAAE